MGIRATGKAAGLTSARSGVGKGDSTAFGRRELGVRLTGLIVPRLDV